jgi:hypothetical protein
MIHILRVRASRAGRRAHRVPISGLDTFESRDGAARESRNPQTVEPIQIAATKVTGFKEATALRRPSRAITRPAPGSGGPALGRRRRAFTPGRQVLPWAARRRAAA